ncbi:hypothetical protein [Anabaena sp. CCY 9402-a]|uniref:hypothetical protein n=1 Tax=Anabaena sp. CCY 9402-a TaxID=3103867 RepID=UPI0039C5C91D
MNFEINNTRYYGQITQQKHQRRMAIASTIMAVLLSACTYETPQVTAPIPLGNVVSEEVKERTDQLIGQTVTIRSQPLRLISPTSFTVTDHELFGSQTILVVNATGEAFNLPEVQNIPIQFTGQVRRFALSDINRDYKLDLQSDLYGDYENRPVIIAQSLALAPQPGDITTNPTPYYGKEIAVTGEVENIRNQTSFTLDEDKLLGSQDLLVLNAKPTPTVNEGEKVAVTGVLRPFIVAELEREYNLTWDLDLRKQLEAEYRNKPVLVATEVYPSAIPQ